MPLPKLKTTGLVGARASAKPATRRAYDYEVRWVTAIEFRSGVADALCIFPTGKNPRTTGLHLTDTAANMLRLDLLAAVTGAGQSVEITNHRFGREQVWERFIDNDAVILADWIARAITT